MGEDGEEVIWEFAGEGGVRASSPFGEGGGAEEAWEARKGHLGRFASGLRVGWCF